MDIYEYAKEYNADYYDFHTGRIFLVQEYNDKIKSGDLDAKIRVITTSGDFIGYARKKDE